MYFLKFLIKTRISEIFGAFRTFDQKYDYENESFTAMFINESNLESELLERFLPKKIILGSGFLKQLSCTLVGGSIVINGVMQIMI